MFDANPWARVALVLGVIIAVAATIGFLDVNESLTAAEGINELNEQLVESAPQQTVAALWYTNDLLVVQARGIQWAIGVLGGVGLALGLLAVSRAYSSPVVVVEDEVGGAPSGGRHSVPADEG